MLQLRPLRQIADGRVLAHETEEHLPGRKRLPDPVDDAAGVFALMRQNEMSDEYAALQHPVVIKLKRTGLTVHFQNGGAGDLRVIRGGGVACCRSGQGVFHVRQVYLHEPLEHTQRLHTLIARAVPHDRDAKGQTRERLGDLRRVVAGGNEVDVVHTFVPQAQKNSAELRDGDLFSVFAAADVAVLAKYAPQIAAGEKDRAAAACAGYARFLTEMRRCARHHGCIRNCAKAQLSVCAVNTASARTDGTKLRHSTSHA